MSDGLNRNDAALWRRWRDGADSAGDAVAEPDALLLAAYAENRLGRAGVDPEFDNEISMIEAWLLRGSGAFDDILEARQATAEPAGPVSSAVLDRAMALIADPQPGVVILRPRRSRIRVAMVAASLVAASLVGFAVGMDDWLSLVGASQTQAYDQELLGPSTPLLGGEEDSAT